jgi:hypothetical protein
MELRLFYSIHHWVFSPYIFLGELVNQKKKRLEKSCISGDKKEPRKGIKP